MAIRDQEDSMFVGNRHVVGFTIFDEDGTTALNLTGLTLEYKVTRLGTGDLPVTSSPVVEMAIGSGIVVTDAVNGLAEATFVEADTISLQPDDYYFELEVFDVTPEGVVVATGTLILRPNVVDA